MTVPQLSRTSVDPVAAAWLAGGPARAIDAVLVSRLERRRIRVVDGHVVDRGLDRADPLDGALLDALGPRGRRDLETVRWRVSRDRRVERIRDDLVAGGLLGGRTRWGRPARTGAGRRLLRELRADRPRGGAWEVALHGRGALTDLALREALEPPVRPAPKVSARRNRPWTRGSLEDAHLRASGASTAAAVGGWGIVGGADCGGFDGGGGGGDGGC